MAHDTKIGDKVIFSGFAVRHPKWWQFWKKPADPNGAYVVTGIAIGRPFAD